MPFLYTRQGHTEEYYGIVSPLLDLPRRGFEGANTMHDPHEDFISFVEGRPWEAYSDSHRLPLYLPDVSTV